MFYPQCPKCGGATLSAESDGFERGTRGVGQLLRHAAHQHPYLKMAHLAAVAGRAIYKRVPGGGEKECTTCGHHFR
ncbi:MAG: hypothetical protein V4461_13160 [Pseudomonadota bacterium]